MQGAVLRLGDDVVAGGVRRLVHRNAGKGNRIAVRFRAGAGGGNSIRECDPAQEPAVGADGEAGDLLFIAGVNLHAAVGRELDRLPGDFEGAVYVGNLIIFADVLPGGVHDLRLGGNVFAFPGVGLAAGDGDGLDAVALGQALGGVAVLGESALSAVMVRVCAVTFNVPFT